MSLSVCVIAIEFTVRVVLPACFTPVYLYNSVLLVPQPLQCTPSKPSSSRHRGMLASRSRPITPDGSCATQLERYLPIRTSLSVCLQSNGKDCTISRAVSWGGFTLELKTWLPGESIRRLTDVANVAVYVVCSTKSMPVAPSDVLCGGLQAGTDGSFDEKLYRYGVTPLAQEPRDREQCYKPNEEIAIA